MNKKKIEYFIFLQFVILFRIVGLNNSRRIAKLLAYIFYRIIPIRKNVVIKNISLAFPEKSQAEIEKIAYKNYHNTITTFVEFLTVKSLTKEKLLSLGSIKKSDEEAVYKADKINKGGIYLTAHFGNWELGALWVGLNFNRCIRVLVKPQSNKYVSDHVKSIREHFGNISIQTGSSIKEIFQTIKNNGIAGIVGDQRGPKELRRVKFFNRDTAIYSGTAAIAIKTGAPIFVMLFPRTENNNFVGILEKISFENLPENKDDQIHEITQRYMSILEKYVRKYPEQMFWMHNLWKY